MDEKDVLRSLGSAIRARRKRAGLTISQLAELAGIDTGFLAYIETAKKMPSLITTVKIAKALHVALFELFRGMPKVRVNLERELQEEVRSLFEGRSSEQRATMLVVLKEIHDPSMAQALRKVMRR